MNINKLLSWIEGTRDFYKKIILNNLWIDLVILLVFNIIYWSKYLLTKNTMVGFLYMQDAYENILVVDYILRTLGKGIIPFGLVWFSPVYNGISRVINLGPAYFLCTFFFLFINNFLISYKITIFSLYLASSLTMYYLGANLHLSRNSRLISSISYTFSQFVMFEIFVGHIGVASAMAIIPLILSLLLKNELNLKKMTFISILISMLIFERPDIAYITLFFLFFFIPFIAKPPKVKSLLKILIPLIATFLITFPFLEFSFLSEMEEIKKSYGVHDYTNYSPHLFQLFTPLFIKVEAYLGLSVLLLSIIGGLSSMIPYLRRKRICTKNEKLFTLLFLFAIVFIIIGLGANTPLYGFLNKYAPFFSGLRMPTRWLIIAQLCLALLAGKGFTVFEKFLIKIKINNLSKRQIKKIFFASITLLIFLDLSTFITYKISEWNSIYEINDFSSLFILPQYSDVSQDSEVYEFIKADLGEYKIFVTPTIYSTSYWDYLRYLRDTNITLASGYAFNPKTSELREDVYYELRKGNITNEIGEKMSLLGIKYVVYDYRRNRWDRLVEKMNYHNDLELILDDGNYILYLNKRFGDIPLRINLLNNPSFEVDGDWIPWIRNNGSVEKDTLVYLSGKSSIKFSIQFHDLAGVIQYYFPNNSEKEFNLSGWSKAENVTSLNYFIRATRLYNNEPSGAYAFFNPGTHDWEYSSVTFNIDPRRELEKLVISFSIRNGTGTVWIDDFSLSQNHISDSWNGFYVFKNLYDEINNLFSEENILSTSGNVHRKNPMEFRIKANVTEKCFIVTSESFNNGWNINDQEDISILNYKGLLTLYVKAPSYLDLTLKFTAYNEFINKMVVYDFLALLILILPTRALALFRS